MQRKLLAAWLLLIVAALLSACGLPAKSEASLTVESYLQALVAKDDARLSTLSCAKWESTALLELDSLQAVETRLEGLSCEQSGTEGASALVTCQGKIVATYNNEDQELDLSLRVYQVTQEGGEYLVCGYQ